MAALRGRCFLDVLSPHGLTEEEPHVPPERMPTTIVQSVWLLRERYAPGGKLTSPTEKITKYPNTPSSLNQQITLKHKVRTRSRRCSESELRSSMDSTTWPERRGRRWHRCNFDTPLLVRYSPARSPQGWLPTRLWPACGLSRAPAALWGSDRCVCVCEPDARRRCAKPWGTFKDGGWSTTPPCGAFEA